MIGLLEAVWARMGASEDADAILASAERMAAVVDVERLRRRARLRSIVNTPVLAGLNDMGDIARLEVNWPWPPRS